MAILKWLFSRGADAQESAETSDDALLGATARRRNFANLSPGDGETPVAPSAEAPAAPPPAAAPKPRAAKKPPAATPAVAESISVILRRQVPIRFDEAPRSWIGGLPQMPAGTEWPRAKPRKPLHFVAQLDCTALPPELWGGLGPRTGWLLLFVDFEAIDEESRRPIARVLHVPELGPEVAPPAGLYFARRDIFDVDRLPGTLPDAQRQHFRQWPVDLVPAPADTSELTGSILYDAPENDLILTASDGFPLDRPMTWRGAYTILAGLVLSHGSAGFESNWQGNGLGMLDYPEPDINGFNKEWVERRERIAAELPRGYHCPEFTAADAKLRTDMYEERRTGWQARAFRVLAEEIAIDEAKLAEYRTGVAEARARGDQKWLNDNESWIEYFEKKIAQHHENGAYLEDLFAQYPGEEALIAEINRVGRAHIDWAKRSSETLRAMLDRAAAMDLDARIVPADWDDIAAEIATMKSSFWQKTFDTRLLRKIEVGISYNALLGDAAREELLDRYAASPSSADALDPDIVANLEPRLRHLETDRAHKLGGCIDSYYGDPLKKGHILLFQMASDGATGWIFGDLGLIYVSIDPADLAAGSFENVRAWLEA